MDGQRLTYNRRHRVAGAARAFRALRAFARESGNVVARRYTGLVGFFWLCALLLFASSVPAHGEPGVPDPALILSGAQLSQALRQGGFVIYFRHADTGPAYPEPGPVDLERCETQRNLNDKGRAEARVIGEQMRRLQVGIGTVFSSEFCRCWQTAELVVGRYQKTRTLPEDSGADWGWSRPGIGGAARGGHTGAAQAPGHSARTRHEHTAVLARLQFAGPGDISSRHAGRSGDLSS